MKTGADRLFAALHALVLAGYLGLVCYGIWLRPASSDVAGVDLILLAAPWSLFARIGGDAAMWYSVPPGILANTYLLYRLGSALRRPGA